MVHGLAGMNDQARVRRHWRANGALQTRGFWHSSGQPSQMLLKRPKATT